MKQKGAGPYSLEIAGGREKNTFSRGQIKGKGGGRFRPIEKEKEGDLGDGEKNFS